MQNQKTMKKLPYISIEGVGNTPEEKLDSLIKLEPILAWMGYRDDVEWNNHVVSREDSFFKMFNPFLLTDRKAEYHTHRDSNNPISHFLASDTKKIIHFVQNYKG